MKAGRGGGFEIKSERERKGESGGAMKSILNERDSHTEAGSGNHHIPASPL